MRSWYFLITILKRLNEYTYPDILLHDSRYLDVDFTKLVGKIDKVLLDPPCSDIGVRPKVLDYKTYRQIVSNYNYQKQFIKVAYKLLKCNGILVYSTCTLTPMENEDIVRYAESIGFEILEIKIPIASKGLNIYPWYDRIVRFYPHIQDTPGFFIALLRKKC